MSQRNCAHEEAVSEAVRSGNWEGSTARHAAECQICREIVQTSRWMQAMAGSVEGGSALPDASLLWWRAQLSERQARLERTQNAVEWSQIVSSVFVSAGLLVWAVWNWRAVVGALAWLSSDVWSRVWLAGYLLAVSAPNTFWPIAVVVSLAMVVLAYPLLEKA
jgi:hypothetical protein